MGNAPTPADRLVLEEWGNRVKQARAKAELSQVEAARRCGITQSTLSKIEAGEYRLHPAMVLRLCTGLDLNPSVEFAWPRSIVEIARLRAGAAA